MLDNIFRRHTPVTVSEEIIRIHLVEIVPRILVF